MAVSQRSVWRIREEDQTAYLSVRVEWVLFRVQRKALRSLLEIVIVFPFPVRTEEIGSGQESTIHFKYPIKVLHIDLRCQPEDRQLETEEIFEHRFEVI